MTDIPTLRNEYIAAYRAMEQRTSYQLLTQRHMPTVSVSELLRCNKQNRIPSGAYFRVVGVVTIVEGGYLGAADGDDDTAHDNNQENNEIGTRGEVPQLFLIDPAPTTTHTNTATTTSSSPVGRSSQSAIRQTIVKSEPIHDDDYYNHGEDGEEEGDEETATGPLFMCEVDCMSTIQRKVTQLLQTMPVAASQQQQQGDDSVVHHATPSGDAEQLQYSLYDEDDPRIIGSGGVVAEMEPTTNSNTAIEKPLSTHAMESEVRDELFCQLDGNIVEMIARVDMASMSWGDNEESGAEEDVMTIVSHAIRVVSSTSEGYLQYLNNARDAHGEMFQMTPRMLSENPFQIIQPFRSMTDRKRITAAVTDVGGMDQLVKEATSTAVDFGVSRRENAVPSFSPSGEARRRLGGANNNSVTTTPTWVAVGRELSRSASTAIPLISSSKIEREINAAVEAHARREKKPPTDFLALAQQQQLSTPRRTAPARVNTTSASSATVNEEEEDYRLAPIDGVNPADSPVVITWKSLGCGPEVATASIEPVVDGSSAPPNSSVPLFAPPPTVSSKALRKALI